MEILETSASQELGTQDFRSWNFSSLSLKPVGLVQEHSLAFLVEVGALRSWEGPRFKWHSSSAHLSKGQPLVLFVPFFLNYSPSFFPLLERDRVEEP